MEIQLKRAESRGKAEVHGVRPETVRFSGENSELKLAIRTADD